VYSDPPKVPRSDAKEGVQYRLFFFNAGGHIEKAHEFISRDDAEAIRISEAWREGRKMELWQRDRRVKRWD